MEYLAELASSVITMINAENYGHTIYDLYMRRELNALGQDLLRHAYKPRLEQEHGAMAIIEQTDGRWLTDKREACPPARLRSVYTLFGITGFQGG
jgi:replicative DNA helicase